MSAETRHDVDDSARGFVADMTATFGGVLLLVASTFDLLQGGSAIANGDLFAEGSEYLYKFDMTAWGWVHIILGVIGYRSPSASSCARPGHRSWASWWRACRC